MRDEKMLPYATFSFDFDGLNEVKLPKNWQTPKSRLQTRHFWAFFIKLARGPSKRSQGCHSRTKFENSVSKIVLTHFYLKFLQTVSENVETQQQQRPLSDGAFSIITIISIIGK